MVEKIRDVGNLLRKPRFQQICLKVVASILFLLIVLFMVFPVYWAVRTAALESGMLFAYPPPLTPALSGFRRFITIFQEKPILARWLLNTAFVSTMTTLTSILFSLLGAYAISRFKFKFRNITQLGLLITQLLPGIVVLIPLYVIFVELGLINTLWGLILSHTIGMIPIATLLLRGFIDSIPSDLEAAAQTDGCTQMGAFFRVIVPLLGPGIGVTIVFVFIKTWGEFMFSRTLLKSESNLVISVGLARFQGQYATSWELLMTASIISAIPVIVAFLLFQRLIVSGLTGGALKQ